MKLNYLIFIGSIAFEFFDGISPSVNLISIIVYMRCMDTRLKEVVWLIRFSCRCGVVWCGVVWISLRHKINSCNRITTQIFWSPFHRNNTVLAAISSRNNFLIFRNNLQWYLNDKCRSEFRRGNVAEPRWPVKGNVYLIVSLYD